MAHDVFISYASQNRLTADAACHVLEARGIRCWIAPRNILPGSPYGESIVDAISACRVLIVVFSSHANESPQVLREVERAVSKAKPILPFRIEDILPSKSMEFFLSSQHWLDALTPPMEKHLGYLADTVKLMLERTPGPKIPERRVSPDAAGRANEDLMAEAERLGLTGEEGVRKAEPEEEDISLVSSDEDTDEELHIDFGEIIEPEDDRSGDEEPK